MQERLRSIGGTKTCPVAVVVRDGRVLMGLRHYTPDKWKKISVWTCPGGRCDEGESVEATLRREVEEEAGISDLKITDFISEVPGAKEGDRVLLFLCKTDQEAKLKEPHKFSEWRWFGVEEIPDNFINDNARKAILNLLSSRS
ncbi:NUDIX hydrolase [Candidatus Kaiserbacteria bacterium]|nr:NUDIX hydrolase [Candidatus Kaiserbacteria bacterium]